MGVPVGFLDPDTVSTVKRPDVGSDEGLRASPDGTQLVLTNYSALHIADADGSNPEQFIDIPGSVLSYPAWSANGEQIVFLRQIQTVGSSQVMLVDVAPGSVPVPLTDPMSQAAPKGLDWSADGDMIVWAWYDIVTDAYRIETISMADRTRVALGEGWNPRFSPDGTTIAFLSGRHSASVIATMDVDGKDRVLHTQSAGTLAWSPDGASIAWADRHLVGVFDMAASTADVLMTGEASDTNFYVWDWAHLELPPFGDIRYDHVFSADIEWMAGEGITKGCNPPGNTQFCPDSVVTRGQMAAFLVRALGLTDRLDDPFVDDDESIFQADIERLAAAGITKGCNPPGNTRFCPDGKVTREQMAAFLVRALGYTDDGGGDLFADDDVSIFEGDIDRMATAGVTKGCNPPTNDRFCPTAYVTRGQMAAFLHRALG
jgi:hypothetical protein